MNEDARQQLEELKDILNKNDVEEIPFNTVSIDTEIKTREQRMSTNTIIDEIKPGRFYILRLRSHDKKWIGRWIAQVTETSKRQMEDDRHVAYDFTLPEGEDITSSTLELRELSEMMNSDGGRWPKLVALRRKAYRDYHKLDEVRP